LHKMIRLETYECKNTFKVGIPVCASTAGYSNSGKTFRNKTCIVKHKEGDRILHYVLGSGYNRGT